MIKQFQEGKVDNEEVQRKVFYLIRDMFEIFKKKEVNDIDINKFMIVK